MEESVTPQDVGRALRNLERILYTIRSDGSPVAFRYHNGHIQWAMSEPIPDKAWYPLTLEYGPEHSNG